VSGERYVLLGLAPPRAPWFQELARWTTSAAVAAEFIKCVSADEVRVRLRAGRRHSALLVDAGLPSFDRDLVDEAAENLTPVIVIRNGRAPSFSAPDLGVAATLEAGFTRDELLEVLSAHCQMIARGVELPAAIDVRPSPLWLAQLFTVCGPGGTGASTLSVALAQGLGLGTLLADLARRADQAMLHDAVDLGPGVQELVEAHRLGRPDQVEVQRHTFDVPRRGYRLLLGLRRPEMWAVLRPRALDAAIEGMRRSFDAVVADVTGDFEGESDGGSIEVEERNYMARTAVQHSTVVVVVGEPGMKGVHSLSGLIRAVIAAGVEPSRIVAAVNRSPRNPRARASLSRALASLVEEPLALAAPVHVPERKLEDLLRDGAPLPAAVADPVVRAVRLVAERHADAPPPDMAPARVEPGSLGSWSSSEAET
jgi:hypothetical protein